jgi:signal peptide peptidase SppA
MSFLSIFRKSKSVSVIQLNGIIAPNMGRRKGLNLHELEKVIEQAFTGNNIQAVALQINSPGGSPVQSEMISLRIRELSEKNNIPVLAFIEDVAASGGYWLACAADEIFASKASIVGSIGVVSSGFGFDKAIEKLGVQRRLYTSGDNKAILDPFLPENKEDVKRLKVIQKELHSQFIAFVKSRRGSKIKDDNKEVFTGAFWSGESGIEIGLIDSFGEMRRVLKERFGNKIKIKEFMPKKKLFGFSSLLAGAMEMLIFKIEERSILKRFGL